MFGETPILNIRPDDSKDRDTCEAMRKWFDDVLDEFIMEKYDGYSDRREDCLTNITEIANAVASHMGKWNTSTYSDDILPVPETDIQKCVHLCDYLASRKHLIFDFDVYAEELEPKTT